MWGNIPNNAKITSTVHREYSGRLKVHLFGDTGVGKTSLIRRFTNNDFSEFSFCTASSPKTFDADGVTVTLAIWDVYRSDLPRCGYTISSNNPISDYLRGTGAIMLCVDISNRKSFETIQDNFDIIRRYAADTPVVLVATKTDLLPHEVSEQEINECAKKLGVRAAYTSAKDDNGVEKAFAMLAKVAIQGEEFKYNITSDLGLIGLKIIPRPNAQPAITFDTSKMSNLRAKQHLDNFGILTLDMLKQKFPIFQQLERLLQNIKGTKEIQFVLSKTKKRLAFQFAFNDKNSANNFSDLLGSCNINSARDRTKEKSIHHNNIIYLNQEDLATLAKEPFVIFFGEKDVQITGPSTSTSTTSYSSSSSRAKIAAAFLSEKGDVLINAQELYLNFPDPSSETFLKHGEICKGLQNKLKLSKEVRIAKGRGDMSMGSLYLLVTENESDARKIATLFNKTVIECSTHGLKTIYGISISSYTYEILVRKAETELMLAIEAEAKLMNSTRSSSSSSSTNSPPVPANDITPVSTAIPSAVLPTTMALPASAATVPLSSAIPSQQLPTTAAIAPVQNQPVEAAVITTSPTSTMPALSTSTSSLFGTQPAVQPIATKNTETNSAQNPSEKSVDKILNSEVDNIGASEIQTLVNYCEEKKIDISSAINKKPISLACSFSLGVYVNPYYAPESKKIYEGAEILNYFQHKINSANKPANLDGENYANDAVISQRLSEMDVKADDPLTRKEIHSKNLVGLYSVTATHDQYYTGQLLKTAIFEYLKTAIKEFRNNTQIQQINQPPTSAQRLF